MNKCTIDQTFSTSQQHNKEREGALLWTKRECRAKCHMWILSEFWLKKKAKVREIWIWDGY